MAADDREGISATSSILSRLPRGGGPLFADKEAFDAAPLPCFTMGQTGVAVLSGSRGGRPCRESQFGSRASSGRSGDRYRSGTFLLWVPNLSGPTRVSV